VTKLERCLKCSRIAGKAFGSIRMMSCANFLRHWCVVRFQPAYFASRETCWRRKDFWLAIRWLIVIGLMVVELRGSPETFPSETIKALEPASVRQ
jgi:hypothetical protein